MIPMDIDKVREVIDSGEDFSRPHILTQVASLKMQLPFVPVDDAQDVFNAILIQEQARLFVGYESCFDAVESPEDMELLQDAIIEDFKESCEEFVSILTS